MGRPPLFDSRKLDTDHPWYVACRDHRYTKAGVKRALSRIWKLHGHLIPEKAEQFVSEFRRDFPARAWELYVLNYLVRSGARLQRSPGMGPDFCAELPGLGRFWVECVVPTHGTGDDAVPKRVHDVGALGPSGPVALRYASAVTDKIAKITKYRNKGVVKPTEPVIIALNQGAIDLSDLHDTEVPLVVRVLFGIGEAVMLLNPYTQERRVDVPPMPNVQKRSGASVPTTIFLDDSSAVVSGILFARVSIFNLFPVRHRLLHLAHHPNPLAPFPIGALDLRGEVWVEHRLAHAGRLSRYGPLSRRRRWPKSPSVILDHES